MSGKTNGWFMLEGRENCIVSAKCPECSKEFFEIGAGLKRRTHCVCGRAWGFDDEERRRMINQAIDLARKAMEEVRQKGSQLV